MPAQVSAPLEIRLPPLHDGQRTVFESRARFKVVCCGRRWGKTHLGVLMCIIVAAKGGRAWWIGPSYPVAAIGWRLLRAMVAPIPGIDVREGDKMIIFPNGGMVQIKSADRPDSLRGESLDFVVFDEVADIKEDAWYEGIRPALASGRDYFNDQAAGGGALFIGTPRGQGNWFYDIFLRAETKEAQDKGWQAFQQPTINNTMIPGLVEEVEAARADMHPTKASQEFDAVFIVGGGVVFHDGWQRWYQMVGDQRVYSPDSSVVLIHDDYIYETASLSACLRFGTSDLALTTKTSADYTVVSGWALTPLKNLLLLDYSRGRMEAPDIVPALHQMRQRWRLAYMGIEKVAFQTSIIQEARRKGMPVRELRPDKDKTARAYNAAAYMQGGKVWWRKTIPEMLTYSTEVMNYPLAPHDDCTDTLSYATADLDKASSGPQLVSW